MLRKKLNIVVLGILFGLLLPIKAYAGVLALGSLFIVSIWRYLSEKSTLYLKVFFVAFLTSLVLFLPLNQGSGGLIELKPFWFLETMMSFPDRVSWQRFGEAMVNYKTGGNIVKAFAAYFVSFAIFIVGNFGTRLFGIRKRKIDNISIFLILILLGGIAANLLFVQKGTAWNTIQFFYYSLFVGSIFAGIAVSEIKKYKALFWTGIVLLTIPTTYATLRHYLPMRPPAMISAEEVRALAYLSNQPKGTALVMPFDRNRAEAASYAPRPLYLYESTSYVSAYSRHSVWLEDEVNLDITDFNWQARREELLEVLKSNNQTEMGKFLEKYKISYVYDVTNNPIFIGLDLVYNEDNFKIYRVSS
jgi:hypothetical protein